jgi:hypothetical protein
VKDFFMETIIRSFSYFLPMVAIIATCFIGGAIKYALEKNWTEFKSAIGMGALSVIIFALVANANDKFLLEECYELYNSRQEIDECYRNAKD